MNSTNLLCDLIARAEQYLKENRYMPSTIEKYRHTWNLLYKECSKKGIKEFDPDLCLSILKQEYLISEADKISNSHRSILRRLKVLKELSIKNDVARCYQKKYMIIPPPFASAIGLYSAYCKEKRLATRTILGKRIHSREYNRRWKSFL